VVNVVLAGAPDKGEAVVSLVQRTGCTSVVFVGGRFERRGVFARASPNWVTVRVGRDEPRSRAGFFLDSHAEVEALLDVMPRPAARVLTPLSNRLTGLVKSAARQARRPLRPAARSARPAQGPGQSGRPAPARAARSDPGLKADRRLAMAVLGQFRLIFRSAKKHFQWVQDRTGVSGAQLWVLAELHRRPRIRVTELARAMGVHQSTASNLIDPLEKRRLIQRDRSSKDQRVVHLSLTRAGRDIVLRAPLPLEGVLPDALNSLGPPTWSSCSSAWRSL